MTDRMEQYRSIGDVPRAARPAALTIGKFEGIHLGHQALFRRVTDHAAAHGLEPAVVSFLNDPKDITGDPDHIEKMIYPLEERFRIIRSCGIRRVVFVPFDAAVAQMTAEDFIRGFVLGTLQARHLVCGEDFRFGAGRQGDLALCRRLMDQAGAAVDVAPHVELDGEKVSSSTICRLILEGSFERVSAMLGRTYAIEGMVQPGRGIGRTLGFPTLNICYPDEVIVPQGVFAARVAIEGRMYPAAMNVGRRPTFCESCGGQVVEIHVLTDEFAHAPGTIRIFPVRKMREEIRFANRDLLKKQIARDCAGIRALLGAEKQDNHG